jgi:predicted RNA-binding Zn-ribbon protein involved in translation (DUF1610 family)
MTGDRASRQAEHVVAKEAHMPDIQSTGYPSDIIVMWTSSNGARCVLAFLGDILQLRLERDGTEVRRAHYDDIRPASDAAQRWRIDWDMESRENGRPFLRTPCPECGDDALEEHDAGDNAKWLRCPSCGEAWILDDADRIPEHDRQ